MFYPTVRDLLTSLSNTTKIPTDNIKRRYSQTNLQPALSHPPKRESEPIIGEPVSIPFNALLSPITTVSLLACIKAAFGPDPSCLGIIIITDLPPQFAALRTELLEFSNKFARMSEDRKEKYADEESSYSCKYNLLYPSVPHVLESWLVES